MLKLLYRSMGIKILQLKIFAVSYLFLHLAKKLSVVTEDTSTWCTGSIQECTNNYLYINFYISTSSNINSHYTSGSIHKGTI